MTYHVDYQKKPVILESGLGVQIDNHVFEHAMAHKVTTPPGTLGVNWCDNLVIKNVVRTSKDTTWKPVYGERSQIRDQYNHLEIQLQKPDSPDYGIHVIFRAYNSGIAFRYFFPEHPNGLYYRVTAENSEFTLPADTKAWYTAWAQGAYTALPLSDWPETAKRPLTLSLPNGLYASLAEAQLTDYAMTKFKLSSNKPNTMVTSMYASADLMSDVGTPWRVVMVAERPGKLMRETTLTTAGAMACIDFAAMHNLQYIMFDAGWYGTAFKFNSDARQVEPVSDQLGIVFLAEFNRLIQLGPGGLTPRFDFNELADDSTATELMDGGPLWIEAQSAPLLLVG